MGLLPFVLVFLTWLISFADTVKGMAAVCSGWCDAADWAEECRGQTKLTGFRQMLLCKCVGLGWSVESSNTFF